MASPKHPQSLMGSQPQSHTVMAVMMAMKATITRPTFLLRMAKSRKTPRQNSTAESRTLVVSVAQEGAYCSRWSASR